MPEYLTSMPGINRQKPRHLRCLLVMGVVGRWEGCWGSLTGYANHIGEFKSQEDCLKTEGGELLRTTPNVNLWLPHT